MTILPLEWFYAACGVVLLYVAVRVALTQAGWRRWTTAAFWIALGVAFILGPRVPATVIGGLVVVAVVLAASKAVASPGADVDESARRRAEAERLGHRLLAPALLLPAVVVAGGLWLGAVRGEGWRLVEAKHVTQVAMGLACLGAWVLALVVTRARPVASLREGGRLVQALGWALILPQMLAALGGIFAKAGVGDVVATLVAQVLPVSQPIWAVLTYAFGMTAFTVVMGNAFAAFPVMTLGVGLPFVVKLHGGNPAILGAFGMLSGYCGTLLTPMAANFNLVPTVLLGLKDPHAVIKTQVPFALAMWCFNAVAMAVLVYRF